MPSFRAIIILYINNMFSVTLQDPESRAVQRVATHARVKDDILDAVARSRRRNRAEKDVYR